MTTFDSHKALEQAMYAMNLHGMVVGKIVFKTQDEAQDFEEYMEYLPTSDWRWMGNGQSVGFIIDKLTPNWSDLLKTVIRGSEGYVVRSWSIV